MSQAPGARLGPYDVVALIGAGGMGEVYRARDTRLGRDVAIKVLPAEFGADADRLQRFEQEARAAAALNHPNILAVYDIGAHESAPFIVSELLEGETLRERLTAGPLPVRKAIDFGIQIAQALSAAHEKGIVHRDVKPENVFINKDGRAKVLDFGLAKLTQPEGAVDAGSNLATTPVHTQHGMVLGTIGYMAPEQVRGLVADHRADIFAFGAVLYEMLSGQRAFRGDTTADTMTAILKEDPADLPIAERKIPPALSRIVDRCLEKNPGARFASASDLAFALDALSAHSGSAPVLTDAGTRPRNPIPWVWASGVAICLVALAAMLPVAIAHFREAPAAMTRFSVDAGQARVTNSPPSISPDGRQIAFVATAEGSNAIWIRSLEVIEPRRLPGIADAQGLFWSPDSRSIAFFSEGKLKRTSATGGPVQILCDAAGIGGSGSWNRDGTIVFGRTGGGGVFRVSASGGAPVKLTTPDAARSETGHTHPFFLPGGDRFVYYAQPAGRLYVRSLDAQDDKELTASNSKAVYSPSGHLLFVRQGTLMAQAFDAARATLSGEAVPVAEGMGVGPAAHSFGVSDTGVLAYRPGVGSTRIQVTAFDHSGTVLKTIGEEGDYRDITLSPDGTRVIVHRHEDPGGGGLWLLDTVRGTTSRFTFAQSHDVQAQWSPDGTRVVFGSNRDGGVINLYQKLSNGAGPDEVLFTSAENKGASDWSSDGRFIVLELNHSKTRSDVWVLPLAGDRKPSPFLQSEFAEGHGRLSPDSRWMAYVSDETARNEVYIQPFPRSGGKWLVSTGGGIQPRWRRDGKELYYLAPAENGLLAVSAVDVLATGATVEVGKPRVVFTTRFAENVTPSLPVSSNAISQSYAPSADGQQFFVLSPATDTVPSPITVVMNWTTGLQKTD